MAARIIKIGYPGKRAGEVRVSKSKINVSRDVENIYDSVSFLVNNRFLVQEGDDILKKLDRKISLKTIINIHNDDGIRDTELVLSLAESIKLGEHIHSVGIPNIKLVITKEKALLLFDGHHSMLAYMLVGKRYLHEIPHMIIHDEDLGYIQDCDILIFYGDHSKKIKNGNWRQYVINWQAAKENQLSIRVQNNMGELFQAMRLTLFKLDR